MWMQTLLATQTQFHATLSFDCVRTQFIMQFKFVHSLALLKEALGEINMNGVLLWFYGFLFQVNNGKVTVWEVNLRLLAGFK